MIPVLHRRTQRETRVSQEKSQDFNTKAHALEHCTLSPLLLLPYLIFALQQDPVSPLLPYNRGPLAPVTSFSNLYFMIPQTISPP